MEKKYFDTTKKGYSDLHIIFSGLNPDTQNRIIEYLTEKREIFKNEHIYIDSIIINKDGYNVSFIFGNLFLKSKSERK